MVLEQGRQLIAVMDAGKHQFLPALAVQEQQHDMRHAVFSGDGQALVRADVGNQELQVGFDHPAMGVTDHLIAWDIPAPPGYLDVKKAIFTRIEPGWEKLFVEGTIDWRHVSWGGVLIDDRPYDETDEDCNCIPAADNPRVSSAEAKTTTLFSAFM